MEAVGCERLAHACPTRGVLILTCHPPPPCPCTRALARPLLCCPPPLTVSHSEKRDHRGSSREARRAVAV